MIDLNLPYNFEKREDISKLYNSLEAKVFKAIKSRQNVNIYYKAEKKTLTKGTIKGFLLAKDFYAYTFKGITQQQLSSVFNYDKLTSTNRHTIITAMNVSVCPYCNINYTSTYKWDEVQKTTADLDHFYVKKNDLYPEYALCLYNFIPSCPVCNSRFKGQKSMTRESHTFPHEEGWGSDIRYKIENLLDCVLDSAIPRVTLEEYGSNQDKINRAKASAELFRIKERYETHHDFVSDLLEKAVIYSESYQEELNSFFQGEESPLLVKYAVFGSPLSDDDCLNTSLGKLKKDILTQLQIY